MLTVSERSRGLSGKTVKSAQRVLEVLEYVSGSDREVTVMDVARDLSYPQSSTSELLSCLVHLGYMRYDRARRTFRPTLRVAVIGHHVGSDKVRGGALTELLDLLESEADGPVAIGMIHERMTRYVHASGTGRIANQIAPGCPLNDPLGKVLLPDWSEPSLRGLMHWRNAENAEVVRSHDLFDDLIAIRRNGYVAGPVGTGLADAGIEGMMVAVRLPDSAGEALSVGTVIEADADSAAIADTVEMLRSAISRTFAAAPVAVAPVGHALERMSCAM